MTESNRFNTGADTASNGLIYFSTTATLGNHDFDVFLEASINSPSRVGGVGRKP